MTGMVEVARSSMAAARTRWLAFWLIAAGVLVADQLSKWWVDASFALAWTRGPVAGLAAPTPLLGDFVRIAKSYNDGGLFGLFGANAQLLAVASVVVIGLIVVFERRSAASSPWLLTVSLGLLLGGALGNLVDRIRLGHVVDFIDVGIGTTRWYTFNVADAAISLAIVGLLLVGLVGERSSPRAT